MDIKDQEKLETELTVSARFDFMPVQGQVGLTRRTEKRLRPRIAVVGGQTDKVTWQYYTTPNISQIIGDRESLMMVRLPLDAKHLKVTVDVEARIKEKFLSKVFNYSKKWTPEDFKDFQEEEFMLKRGIKRKYKDLHAKRSTPNFATDLLSIPSMSEEDKSVVIAVS